MELLPNGCLSEIHPSSSIASLVSYFPTPLVQMPSWLEKEHGLSMEYGTVYGWVRYRLGAKLKVPRPKSYKQDEEVVSGFKKNLVAYY